MTLASYAASDATSRGRVYSEPKPAHRSEYQRDRDRIIHCAAFRRLEYKTQVFVNHEGDLFRTRLTHSIEVAQIARSIARSLRLNEDLTEAIALAHDLGHTPFGHAGQDALNECMRGHGGFEHNLQSLRVVDTLEERYADFAGLNLTYETREGILKHCPVAKAREMGELGERFLRKTQPTLEAQLVNLADEIAYNNHDVDDGLRSGLISIEQLSEVALFEEHRRDVQRLYPALTGRRVIHETIRRMIGGLVNDVIAETTRRLEAGHIHTLGDVRAQTESTVGYSMEVREKSLTLKRFLRNNLYSHQQVERITRESVKAVHDLFAAFFEKPGLLPAQYREKLVAEGPDPAPTRARTIADYIAGMTDRYALKEHERVCRG